MFDAFPYDEWGEDIAGFWTFGPEHSTGTFMWFVPLESQKLAHQQPTRRASGALDRPGGVVVTTTTTTIVTEEA